MLRQLILTLTGLLLSFQIQALGLSRIEVYSKLNEPLNAKIEVISVPKGEAGNIRINLASNESFRRAGLDRTQILTSLQFKVQATGNTGAVIRLSSQQPLREPFLNFLLEVTWPSGRILREYTVLLDPPLYEKKLRAVTAPPPSPPLRALAADTPVRLARTAVAKSKAATKPSRTSTPRVSKADRRESSGSSGRGGSYSVSSNDTLWQIANQTKPRSVSLEQHMVNIYHANSGAFIRRNMNLIQAGKTLKIPGWDGKHVAPPPARRVAKSQTDDTSSANRTAEETEAAPESAPPVAPPPTKKTTVTEPQVTITAPDSPNQQEGSVGDPQNEQLNKLNKEVKRLTEANVSINAENKELKKELGSTKDLVVTMKKQLDEVNNLLKLQNQNLAKLQEQLAKQTKEFDKRAKDFAQVRQELVDAKKAIKAVPPTIVAAIPEATAKSPATTGQTALVPEKSPTTTPLVEVKPTIQDPTAPPAESTSTPPTVPATPGKEESKEVAGRTGTPESELTPKPILVPTGEEIISTTGKPEDTTAEDSETTTESTTMGTEIAETSEEKADEADNTMTVKEDTQKTPPVVVKPTASPPVEASLMDTANDLVNQVPGGWLTIGGVGGGTVLLLLLGGFLKRRRKDEGGVAEWKDGTELTEGEILAELARLEAETPPPEPMPNNGDEPNSDEINILDNLKEEPADEDLLENVDVYIAYETFDKAEELLKPAIEQHPTVQKYHLKLLEVYATTKQEDKFEAAAKVFYAETGGQSPFWDEVLTQWNTLDTGRPLEVSEVEFTPVKPAIKAKPDQEEDNDGLGLATGLAGAAALGAGAAMVFGDDEESTDTEMDNILAGLDGLSGSEPDVNAEGDNFSLDLGTSAEGLEELNQGNQEAGDDNDTGLSLNLGDDLDDLGLDLESNVTEEATTEETTIEDDDGLSFTTGSDLDLEDDHETTITAEETDEMAFDSSTDDELTELTANDNDNEDNLSLDLGETFEDPSNSEVEDLSLDMGHEETEALALEDDGLSFDDDSSSDFGETTDEDTTAIGSDDDLSFDDESAENLSAESAEEDLSMDEDLSMELDGDTETVTDAEEEDLSLDGLREEEIPEPAQDHDELSLLDDEELSLGTEATEAAASSATEEDLSLDFEENNLDFEENNTEIAPSIEEESLSLDEFSEDETTALSTETDFEEDLSLGDLDSELDTTSEETEAVETDELSLAEDLSVDTDNETEVATTMDATEDDLSIEEDSTSAAVEDEHLMEEEDLSLDSEESSDMGMADEVSIDEPSLEEDGELSFDEELSSDTLGLDTEEGAEPNATDLDLGSEELSLGDDDDLSLGLEEEEETASVTTDALSLEEDEGSLADFAETEALSTTDAMEEPDLSMDLEAEDLDANLSLDDLDSDTDAAEIADISSTVEDEDAMMPTLDEDSELTTTGEISDDNELDMGSLGLDDDLTNELGIQLDDDDSTLNSGSDNEFGDLLTGMEDNEFGELSGESEMNLDGSDDVNSKFDLAQMYIDIEDTDSARTTLEEIIAEGDDEQKQRAQKMMKGL